MALNDVAIVAGTVSTFIFVGSYLPMLVKAIRTRDLSSYSALNLVLANVGNAVHSVYVFSLPAGPLWVLHSFYLLASALMLAWWARFKRSTHAFARRSDPSFDRLQAAEAWKLLISDNGSEARRTPIDVVARSYRRTPRGASPRTQLSR